MNLIRSIPDIGLESNKPAIQDEFKRDFLGDHMRSASPDWDKVGMLLERHAHLNQLRVGAVQVYLVVVAAVLALLGGTDALAEPNSFAVPLGICLIGVGLLVFMYDLRLRARTYAVAAEVSRSVPDEDSVPAKMKPHLFDEDLVFSMVLMLVNSTLVYVGLEYLVASKGSSGILVAAIAAGFFAAQILFYCWHWPRLARNLSAWPDRFAPSGATNKGTSDPGESSHP